MPSSPSAAAAAAAGYRQAPSLMGVCLHGGTGGFPPSLMGVCSHGGTGGFPPSLMGVCSHGGTGVFPPSPMGAWTAGFPPSPMGACPPHGGTAGFLPSLGVAAAAAEVSQVPPSPHGGGSQVPSPRGSAAGCSQVPLPLPLTSVGWPHAAAAGTSTWLQDAVRTWSAHSPGHTVEGKVLGTQDTSCGDPSVVVVAAAVASSFGTWGRGREEEEGLMCATNF